MLFFHSALIPQWCLHFIQKFRYYTLENKGYSRKIFWEVVAINVNAGEVKGTVKPLGKDQEQTLMGSMDVSAETISSTEFLLMPWYS